MFKIESVVGQSIFANSKCNSCLIDEPVLTIKYGPGKSLTVIALCPDCAEELQNDLEDAMFKGFEKPDEFEDFDLGDIQEQHLEDVEDQIMEQDEVEPEENDGEATLAENKETPC